MGTLTEITVNVVVRTDHQDVVEWLRWWADTERLERSRWHCMPDPNDHRFKTFDPRTNQVHNEPVLAHSVARLSRRHFIFGGSEFDPETGRLSLTAEIKDYDGETDALSDLFGLVVESGEYKWHCEHNDWIWVSTWTDGVRVDRTDQIEEDPCGFW